jgi:hypothetical protein
MNVLNIAAGFLPLDKSDFGVDQLVNYDPLPWSKNTVNLIGHLAIIDVNYVSRRAGVDSIFANGSVDLVMSISPYGFALVDDWVHGKLKPGGYVLAFGNERNKWLQDTHMFAGTLQQQYRVVSWNGASEPQISDLARKVKRDYPSSTTDLQHDTTINEIVCAIRKP